MPGPCWDRSADRTGSHHSRPHSPGYRHRTAPSCQYKIQCQEIRAQTAHFLITPVHTVQVFVAEQLRPVNIRYSVKRSEQDCTDSHHSRPHSLDYRHRKALSCQYNIQCHEIRGSHHFFVFYRIKTAPSCWSYSVTSNAYFRKDLNNNLPDTDPNYQLKTGYISDLNPQYLIKVPVYCIVPVCCTYSTSIPVTNVYYIRYILSWTALRMI